MKVSIKAMRVNAGLSQDEAAKALNVSKVTIANWENGTASPRLTHLKSLIDLYQCTIDDIILPMKQAKSE